MAKLVFALCMLARILPAATDAQEAYFEQLQSGSALSAAVADAYLKEIAAAASVQATGFNGAPLIALAPRNWSLHGGYGSSSWSTDRASDAAHNAFPAGVEDRYLIFPSDMDMRGPFLSASLGLPHAAFVDAVDVSIETRFSAEAKQKNLGFGVHPRVDWARWGIFYLQTDLSWHWVQYEREGLRHGSGMTVGGTSFVPGYSVSESDAEVRWLSSGSLTEVGAGADVTANLDGLWAKIGLYEAAVFGTLAMQTSQSGQMTLSGAGTPSTYSGPLPAQARYSANVANADTRIRAAVQMGSVFHLLLTGEYSLCSSTLSFAGGLGLIL